MSERPTNLPASIAARLANEARKSNRPFGEILQYYGMERFLYRLSRTKYADSFLLKGGLLFYGWNIPERRVTRDIDFLSLLNNHIELLSEVIRDAMSLVVLRDGIRFDPTSLVIVETQVNADRRGIRATFAAYLGKARIPIQLDLGFSDEITSNPNRLQYPSLLPDLIGPMLQMYPVESVVAEKLHAIERWADVPSRWNDYYDIWLISQNFELADSKLRSAIHKTYETRHTEVPGQRPFALSPEFAALHQKDWSSFLTKSDLQKAGIASIGTAVEAIWTFLEWPIAGMKVTYSGGGRRIWLPRHQQWRTA